MNLVCFCGLFSQAVKGGWATHLLTCSLPLLIAPSLNDSVFLSHDSICYLTQQCRLDSLSLPQFFCHHHLLAILFSYSAFLCFVFTAWLSEPAPCMCSGHCKFRFEIIFKHWFKYVCRQKLHAWLLTYAWGEMPEPWSLEVTSMRLETFYRCSAFQDLHNWWGTPPQRITLINPCDYETTQEPKLWYHRAQKQL